MSNLCYYPDYFEDDEETHVKNFTETMDNKTSIIHKSIHDERLYLLGEQLEDLTLDINIQNKNFETPILAALRIANRDVSVEMVKRIAAKNPNINLPDYEGNAPLHEISKTIAEGQSQLLDTVLGCPGRNVNIKNHLGETPLHVASSVQVVQALLDHGADVNAVDNSKNSPLHRHVAQAKICKILIKRGALLHHKNIHGFTPLHEAVSHNAKDTVSLLLQKGANVNLEANSKHHVTALHVAFSRRADEEIKKLLWTKTKPMYLGFVAGYDANLVPEVLKIWQETNKTEMEIVTFLKQQIHFLGSCPKRNLVPWGKVLAQYFLSSVARIGKTETKRLIRKFSACFPGTLLNFLIKSHDYRAANSRLQIYKTVEVLLSHGEVLDYSDLEVVYLQFGDNVLLHKLQRYEAFPLTRKLEEIPLFPRLLWDVSLNITDIINNKNLSNIDVLDFFDIHNLARYCTFPTRLIKKFSETFHNILHFEKSLIHAKYVERDIIEMEKRGGVPSLLELSRNAVRPALCHFFNVSKPHQLREILKKIPLPGTVIDFVMMTHPIYPQIRIPDYYPSTRHLYLI